MELVVWSNAWPVNVSFQLPGDDNIEFCILKKIPGRPHISQQQYAKMYKRHHQAPSSKPSLEITRECLNSPGFLPHKTQEGSCGKDQKHGTDLVALLAAKPQLGALFDKMLCETSFTPEERQYLTDKHKIYLLTGDHPEETEAEFAKRPYDVPAQYEKLLKKARDTTDLMDAIQLLKELKSDNEGFFYAHKTIKEEDWKNIQSLIQVFLKTKTTRDWYTCIDFVSGL